MCGLAVNVAIYGVNLAERDERGDQLEIFAHLRAHPILGGGVVSVRKSGFAQEAMADG